LYDAESFGNDRVRQLVRDGLRNEQLRLRLFAQMSDARRGIDDATDYRVNRLLFTLQVTGKDLARVDADTDADTVLALSEAFCV
jgi:hypothetical protein